MGPCVRVGGRIPALGVVAAFMLALALPGPSLAAGAAPSPGQPAAQESPQESVVGNYLAGRYAHHRFDLSAAANFMARALDEDPDNPTLVGQTFLLTAAAGWMTEAVALARRVTETKPDDSIANYVLATEDLRAGELAAAEARLDQLPRENINRFLAPVLTAWARIGQARTAEALTALEASPEARGFDVLRRLHLAFMNEYAGNMAAAEQALDGAEASIGRMPFRVMQAVGGFYERRGRIEDARAVYRQYAEDVPDSFVIEATLARLERGEPAEPLVASPTDGFAEAFYHMAGALQRDRVSPMALVFGRLAVHLRPDFPEARILVGQILEAQGRHREAIAMYRTIDPGSPFSWATRLRIAGVYRSLERYDEAESLLRAMAAEQTQRFDALVQLGQMFRANDRFAEAVEVYDQAIRLIAEPEPRHWRLFYARGIALERSMQWPRAERDFQKALELEPEEPYVLNYLGYSWVDRGENLEQGKQMLLRAVELRPRDGYIVDSLGWVYYRLRRYDEAVEKLERAVELRPQDPVINDHLGDAYWRVGRTREARFQWRRALSFDPEPDLVREIETKQRQGLAAAVGKSDG